MSPAVDNFVHSLVEMAKSHEMLPQLERDIANLTEDNATLRETVQARELAIIRYKEDIETLHSRIRSLEVERDDAGFRELEAIEALDHLKSDGVKAVDLLNEAMRLLNPPKPEPVAAPENKAEEHPPQVDDPSLPINEPFTWNTPEPTPVNTEAANDAPSAATGSEPSDDPEPIRYDESGWHTRQEWWDWSDRQGIAASGY